MREEHKYVKCNKCGWVHFISSVGGGKKCGRCGISHKFFVPANSSDVPFGSTVSGIVDPAEAAPFKGGIDA